MRGWRRRAAAWAVVVATGAGVAACGGGPQVATTGPGGGPAARFRCTFDVGIDALVGADATAAAIGWAGNHQGVVTCLGGTFFVQDGIDRNYGFGIYQGAPLTWRDADGYLPAQITTFRRDGATVAITEFADRVVLGGAPFVAVYSRVAVHNPTDRPVAADPEPSPGLVPLDHAPATVAAHHNVDHDYVVAVDRFGGDDPWPSASALAGAGGFARHFAHMRAFWDAQLAGIAEPVVPDSSLDDAYRAGFITTQIARSGDDLDTGVNGYEGEYSHDVVGILATLFTEGDLAGARALLLEARHVVGSQGQYPDGLWTYAWPWAIYLMKTGDVSFVRANFAKGGAGAPSIEASAHDIATDRTGPGGIMEATDDIDTDGYWTVDGYEALTGLAAYAYIARRVGDAAEARWATAQYDSLLAATNTTLDRTITDDGLDYLPCSMVQPDTANRCSNPEDANWAATFEFGKWAWQAPVFGSPVSGPGIDLIDATYDYGFARLQGLLPTGTFGGFPSDWFSTAYDAGYGSWGLASQDHRDQGILGYEFMIADDQSGPWSWWESSGAPSARSPWQGSHPGAGQGSSPHAWGLAEADEVLLDSLVTQRADGALIVGRGVPAAWLGSRTVLSVAGFPTVGGARIDVAVTSAGTGTASPTVTLALRGTLPPGPVLFELPAFVGDVAAASTGTVDEAAGTVSAPAGTRRIVVRLGAPTG